MSFFDRLKGLFAEEKAEENRPMKVIVVPRDVNDKFSEYPSEGLTPDRLTHIFHAADMGDVREQMELFEEIEEKDTHVASQMQTRKLAVLGLEWELQAAGDSDMDKQVAEFVKGQIEYLFEMEDNPVFDMLDAIGKGISVSEIEWGIDLQGRNVIRDLRYIPPKKLIWDAQTDEMMICTRENPNGVVLPENKFVVHRYKARSGHTSRAGLLRSVAWMYLFKNYSVKDWVTFCEVYGMPVRIGKYAESASDDDKEALMRALIQIGADAAGIISQACEIEIRDSNKSASGELYKELAKYCDEQNSKAIVGQTLTADSGGGSYAQGKVHGDVRQDLIKADAAALEKTINRDIIRPLVRFNFGCAASLPKLKFNTEEDEDLKLAAEVYRIVISDLGLPVAEDHLYEKFNIPKPGSEDRVLERRFPGFAGTGVTGRTLKGALPTQAAKAQAALDDMTSKSMEAAPVLFEGMLQPLRKLLKEASSMEELKDRISDQTMLNDLVEEMSTTDMRDALHYAIYMSELLGRGTEI